MQDGKVKANSMKSDDEGKPQQTNDEWHLLVEMGPLLPSKRDERVENQRTMEVKRGRERQNRFEGDCPEAKCERP